MRSLTRVAIVVAAAAVGLGLVYAGQRLHLDSHRVENRLSRGQSPIEIRINPEARVSASVTGAWPTAVSCGAPVEIPVEITNQGYVTARLEARLMNDPVTDATLDFHPEPLTGAPQETRMLRITLTKPGPTDLTIAFRSHNEVPDLGARDRIHILMHCQ